MKRLVLTAFVLACSASAVQAAPIISPAGPGGYPAPGGTTFASVGNAGNTGGAVRSYSGFDTSAWSELYFGFSAVTGPWSDGVGQNMTYSHYDLANQEFVWTAANSWTIGTTSGPITGNTVQFRQSFWNLANSVNINGAAGAVGGVPMPYVLSMDAATLAGWGGGFTVRAAFTVNGSSMGINNFFTGISQKTCISNCVQSGTSGTFYYEPPTAVPEPASLFLLGSGLFGIGYKVRRRMGRPRLA